MAAVSDAAADVEVEYNHIGGLAVAILIGAGLVIAARSNAVALLAAVAALQALLAFAWVFGTGMPGRVGGLVIVALASAGADVTVSVWPHSRLGTLLIVFGLSVPVMFVHQVMRGAARVRLIESLGGIAFAVFSAVSAAALIQLRHEWVSPEEGGKVVAGVVAAAAGALVVGYLVDMVMPAPHFDPAVPRGLLAVVGSAGVGGSIGHLLLRSEVEFLDGRGAFVGAAVGALIGFVAVAVSFVEASTPMPAGGFARRVRPALGVVIALSLAAPVGYLVALAIRT